MQIFTIQEASAASRMSVAWWRRKILDKDIKYLKVGRRVLIPKSTVDDILKRAVVEPRSHSKDER